MPPTSQDRHDTRPIVRKTGIAVAVLGAIQLVLGITGSVLMVRGLHSDDAERAREYAAARMGPGYSYYTERIDLQYGPHVTVFAIVQAWNEKGIVTVPVRWERQSVSR